VDETGRRREEERERERERGQTTSSLLSPCEAFTIFSQSSPYLLSAHVYGKKKEKKKSKQLRGEEGT
jgi:hypothetical protein